MSVNHNKTYCVSFKGTVAAGANANNAGGILQNKPVNLKSFWWDLRIIETVNKLNLPLDIQTTQNYTVTIGNYIWGDGWVNNMADFSDPPNAYNDGNRIISFHPQQMFFDNMYCVGGLQVGFTYYNWAAALSYDFIFSLYLEVEILPFEWA